MSVALLLALQAAPAAPVAPQLAPELPSSLLVQPLDFDLADLPTDDALSLRRCNRGRGDAIVVCGRRPAGSYDIEYWEQVFTPRPIRAEVGIAGNLSARAFVEGVELPGGIRSNRVMVGIRLPF